MYIESMRNILFGGICGLSLSLLLRLKNKYLLAMTTSSISCGFVTYLKISPWYE